MVVQEMHILEYAAFVYHNNQKFQICCILGGQEKQCAEHHNNI